MLKYIDTSYKPKKTDLLCEFYVEPVKGVSLEEACNAIAGESSIGSWDNLKTLTKDIVKRLRPYVYYVNKKTNHIEIAYPSDLFEPGNMPGILSSIAGNIYGMSALKHLRLNDIHFPKEIMDKFYGPKFGVPGIRKITGIYKRPIVGTIIKPKVGLNSEAHARVAYESWLGGLDLVKDDENLVNLSFNQFQRRAVKTLRLKKKVEKETGEKKLYIVNVSAETKEMLKRARFVKSLGGECVMVDIITCGWAAVQTLRQEELGLILHAHRAGHGMFTEDKKHGMSMLTVAKIARLVGVDTLHIGAIFGKMKSEAEEVKNIDKEIKGKIINSNRKEHILKQEWYNVKPVFSVCSGGLYPGVLPYLVEYMGNDIICQAGAGVHGHPKGTLAGAKATRQAVDAIMKSVSLKEYAKTHNELREAIEHWGVEKHKKYRY